MASVVLRCPLCSPPVPSIRRRASPRRLSVATMTVALALGLSAPVLTQSSPPNDSRPNEPETEERPQLRETGQPAEIADTQSPAWLEIMAGSTEEPTATSTSVAERSEAPGAAPLRVETLVDEETGKPLKARELRRRAGIDPCELEQIEGQSWIDRINRGLHRAVCSSALWFDDLFGNEIYENYDRGTYGRLMVGVEYDDREEIGEITRFRAKFDLPKAEQRLSGFIGRGDRDEIVSDQVPRTGALPNLLSLPDEDEWLVGLGYAPQRSRRNSDWSVDIGADIEFPINWYAKARYKHVLFPTNASMMRYRQTIFWEKDDGWGVTSRLDWDFLMANEMLLRWRSLGTVSEGDMGVDWYSEVTLFQNLGEDEALAYQISVSGETDAPVPVEHVLGRVIYRRSILREWFFLDVRPGVSYRRDEREEDREFRPMLAVGFEILFGRQPK